MNTGREDKSAGGDHGDRHHEMGSGESTTDVDAAAETAAGSTRRAEPAADQQSRAGAAGVSEDPWQRGRDTVYRLLAVRARSYAELHAALLRKGVTEDVAEDVLRRFVDAGLVDDAAFAREWVQSRQHAQLSGRRALGYELRRKGVADDLVRAALETVDESAEETQARELVRRKLRATRGDSRTRMRRLLGLLGRKGYAEGLSFRVVREELEQSGVDAAELDAEEPGHGGV